MKPAPAICRPLPARPLSPLLAVLLAATGCSRSCKDDRPYVPYAIDAPATADSNEPGAADPAAAPGDSAAAQAKFSPVAAERAPAGAATVTVDGAQATAPSGKVFTWLLKGDYDGDGLIDLAAWVQPAAGPGGELVWAQRKQQGFGPVTTAAAPPAFSAPDGCTLEPSLAQVGPRTVQLSLTVACGDAGAPGRPRWLAVVMPARQPALRLEASIELPPHEDLSVEADGSDRDGDGLDDVTLTWSLGSEPPPFEVAGAALSAELHYFDRSAGLSRDPHEPAASMQSQASRLARLSKKKGALPEVASGVRRLRRLHDLLCAQGLGAPILLQGQLLQCAAPAALADADLAEVDAALKAGETLQALAAAERMERTPAIGSKKAAEARARIDKTLTAVQVEVVELGAKLLLAAGDEPGWGPLSYTPDGALLIREHGAVRRFEPGVNTAPEGTPAAWPVAAASPDHTATLLGVRDLCDGHALRALFRVQGAGETQVAIPVASLGRSCVRYLPQPSVVPVSWGPEGLELLVNHAPYRLQPDLRTSRATAALSGQPPTGSGPRSPDGRRLVVATASGLVVMGPQPQLWKHARLSEGHRKLRDCTVANDAAEAACVHDGGLLRVIPRAGD